MNSPASITNVWETWEDSLPCLEPPPGDWATFLYGCKPTADSEADAHDTVDRWSKMTLIAFDVLKKMDRAFGMAEAWDVAQDHYERRFAKLLVKRKPKYNCKNFESYCWGNIERFARREGSLKIRERKKLLSVSTLSRDDDELTMDCLAGVAPSPIFDIENAETRSLFDRAESDLPANDRAICRRNPCESGEPSAKAPAKGAAERKAASLMIKRRNALCLVLLQTESEDGRGRIRRAILYCIPDLEDGALAVAHLLDGKGLDDLRRADESSDNVRFCFLRAVNRMLPVIDPERLRAVDLLPDRHRKLIAEVFFKMRPVEDIAFEQVWTPAKAQVQIRIALADLRVLHTACVSSKSPKGVAELEKLADRVSRPGRFLIRRIVIGGESLPEVAVQYAPQYHLTEDQTREELLKALKSEM